MPTIYTRSGDDGTTKLLFGGRVLKSDVRCEAYGSADHAVSVMGLARSLSTNERVKAALLRAQREMFTVESELATDATNYDEFASRFHAINEESLEWVEKLIDELLGEVELPPKFIIPGASPVSGALDMARSALRSAERRIVALDQEDRLANRNILRYVNRLSDLLFMLARYEDRELPMDVVTGTRL